MIFNQSKLNKQWEIKALSELGDFTRGKSRHRPRNDPKLFQNGIYPFIQTGDIKEADLYLEHHTENYNEFGLKQSKLWKENTLCITIAANIAETALLKYPMCFPDSVVGFTAYEGVSSELFMHYIFTFIKKSIQSAASGSIQDNINIDFLTKLKFRIPSKTEQDKIAAVLSALDKKIALNKQINARLEEMAKTLYDYWFVQFDFPDANGKPYKSSGGEIVFDETLKREIPKGWEVKQISHWIKADKSGDWGKEQQEGNYTVKVNCVRGADINAINLQGNIETPIRFILAKNEHKFLSPFDFIVEISGGSPTQSTGRLAPISQYVLDRFDLPLICSNFCKAISLKDTSYFYQFAFMWSDIYKNNILFGWEGKTSGIKNLLFDNFVNGYFECFPPKEIAEQFFKIIDKNHQEQQLLLKQNYQLTQLRDFLLPMLMNGQVSVAE